MRKKIGKNELKTIRLAATYLKKAADIIYNSGDGNLYTNGLSEKAYSTKDCLLAFLNHAN